MIVLYTRVIVKDTVIKCWWCEFDDTLGVVYKKPRRVQNDSKLVDLINWKSGVVVY